jgi:hypothetical protein
MEDFIMLDNAVNFDLFNVIREGFEFDGESWSRELSTTQEKIEYLERQFDHFVHSENHYCEKENRVRANIVFVVPYFTKDKKAFIEHDRKAYYKNISEAYEIVAAFLDDPRLNIISVMTKPSDADEVVNHFNTHDWTDYVFFLNDTTLEERNYIGTMLTENKCQEFWDGLYAFQIFDAQTAS